MKKITNKQMNVKKVFNFLFFTLLLLFTHIVFAQNTTVTGTVSDDSGETLIGVSIAIKGTTRGVITDVDGKYSIPQLSSQSVLVFSYVGYLSQEITVGNRTSINVSLREDSQTLDEVVFIGYGAVKRGDVTGSVVSVNADEMLKRNPLTVDYGLQGAAAGVAVYRNSGDPSGSTTVRIRGIATLNNSTSPLYVVDGVPAGTNANFLNPNDIESIEVLKDASAAAIYGSRGANGVIMITTKRGQRGQTRMNFSANYNVTNRPKFFDVLSAADFVHMARETAANDGTSLSNPAWIQYDTQLTNYDWQREMTQSALQQTYNYNITGGNEGLQSVFSLGYVDNNGAMIYSNFKRLTARLNIDGTIKNFIKTGLNINYNYDESIGTGSRNSVNYAATPPTMDQMDYNGNLVNVPIRWENEGQNPWGSGIWGHFLREANGNTNRGQDNPVAAAATNRNRSGNNRILVSTYIDISIMKDLNFKTIGSIRANEDHSNNYSAFNPRRYDTMESPDQLSFSGGSAKTLNLSTTLTYIKTINENNRFNLMATWEVDKYDGQTHNINVRELPFPTLRQISSGNQTTLGGGGNLRREDRSQSFLGRVIYTFKERYTFTGTVRRDGSSHFGPGNRYGTFPSAALMWRINEESFMKNQGLFSKLQLAVSWGQTGNAGNSTNEYVDQLTSNRIIYWFYDEGGSPVASPGLAKTTLVDTNLKWETNESTNIRLEMGFLKNKLTATAEYFIRDSKDLLLRRTVRPSTGYQNIYTNAGHIRNSGVELMVTYQNRVGNWNYSVKLNGSSLTNKAIDVGEPIWGSSGVQNQDQWNNWSRTVDGLPINHWYGYRVEGVFQNQGQIDEYNGRARAASVARGDESIIQYYQTANTKPGDFIYKDLDGTGHITADDREVLGNGIAKLNYGLNIAVSYKNWDLNMFMYGVGGQKILSYSQRNLTFNNISGVGYRNILKSSFDEAWRADKPNNEHSRLTSNDQNQNRRVSDYFIHNGDFLRFQNLQLGYSVPKDLIRPLKMENVRVNIGVENLFIITGYKFGNPEIGGNSINQTGLDTGGYPLPSTISFGLSVGF